MSTLPDLSRLRPARRHLPHAVIGVAVLVQALILGWMVTTLHFIWGDDDDFLFQRGTVPGIHEGWLAPHDDHWSTVTIAIYRVLFALFGIRTYVPYGMVPVILHLAVAVTAYLLLRRAGASAWASVVVGLVLIFLGAGSGAILWSVTMGSIGSVLCGLLALAVVIRGEITERRRAVIWVILLIGLMFSGVGVTAVACVSVFVFLRSGTREAVRIAILPTSVFVIWFLAYGRGGTKEPLADRWNYAGIPELIWTALVTHLERLLVFPGSGLLALLALLGVLFLRGTPSLLRDLGLTGAATALFQVTLAGITRPEFGPENFNLPRYGYFTIVFLAPAMAIALDHLAGLIGDRRRIAAALGVWLLIGILVNGIFLFRSEQNSRVLLSGGNEGMLRGIRAAAGDGEKVLTPTGPDFLTARFRADLIAEPEMRSELPAGEPSEQQRLTAEGLYFTAVRPEEQLPVAIAPRFEFDDAWRARPRPAKGCETYTSRRPGATIVLDSFDAGAQLGVYGPTDEVTTVLERDDVQGGHRVWAVEPMEAVFVGTTAKQARLRISFDEPGDYYVCL